jgi:hypothetical protein
LVKRWNGSDLTDGGKRIWGTAGNFNGSSRNGRELNKGMGVIRSSITEESFDWKWLGREIKVKKGWWSWMGSFSKIHTTDSIIRLYLSVQTEVQIGRQA